MAEKINIINFKSLNVITLNQKQHNCCYIVNNNRHMSPREKYNIIDNYQELHPQEPIYDLVNKFGLEKAFEIVTKAKGRRIDIDYDEEKDKYSFKYEDRKS